MNAHRVIQVMRPLHDVVSALAVRHLHDTGADPKHIAAQARVLRDQLFQFRHMANILVETAKRNGDSNLRMLAGVMYLIDYRVKHVGECYELFDEIPDKQFVIEVGEFVSENTLAMLKKLSAYDLGEILEMAYAYEQLDDLKYLIDHADVPARLEASRAKIHAKATRQMVVGAVAVATVSLATAVAVLTNPWLALVPLVVGIAVGMGYNQQQNDATTQYADAKKSCDSLRVQSLLARYQSLLLAKREYEHLHRIVKAFFGDISPSTHLTGVFAIIQMQMEVGNTHVNVANTSVANTTVNLAT
jgi:hypothetical protein